jgi:hypothetical protein
MMTCFAARRAFAAALHRYQFFLPPAGLPEAAVPAITAVLAIVPSKPGPRVITIAAPPSLFSIFIIFALSF